MKLITTHICIYLFITLIITTLCVPRNLYHGQKISANSLKSLIRPLPDDAAPVLAWIEEHADDIRYLAATPKPLSYWADKKYHGKKTIQSWGIENRGSNNFVFKLPGTCWWIKISGPLRRLINIYVYNTGTNPFAHSEYALHNEFSNREYLNSFEIVPTFQTISRYANLLLCDDVIARNHITKVYFPEIYLVHIPGNPTDISDDNYIIIERDVENIENICDHPRSTLALTKKSIKQLYQIITQGGIFDFNGENLRIDDQNNLVFIDLEQAIVENPADFYNKNKDIFDLRVCHGIESFADVHLEKESKEFIYFKNLIMNDPALLESAYWARYAKLFKVRKRRLTRPSLKKRNIPSTSLAASLAKYPVNKETLKRIGNKTNA
ncbi:MAG: hypothetical protein AB7F19_03165 [Candidatus Babeliales bacterium]